MDLPLWAKWFMAAVGVLAVAIALVGLGMIEALEQYQAAIFVLAAVLGLVSASFFFLAALHGAKASPLAKRLRRRVEQRRISRDRERCRAQHEHEIRAWEAFYEDAHKALHFYVEVRDERISSTVVWPEFRRYLQQAEASADALPDPHRSPARMHLSKIVQAIEGEGRTIPRWPATNLIVDTCQAALEWINAHRASYLLPLYRRCGIREPHWPDRINLPIGDDLERLLLAAEVTPPAAPPPTKSGS